MLPPREFQLGEAIMWKWFWLPVLASAPLLAQAASFDCAKASAPVDQLICASPALSEQDEKLSAAFKQAKTQTGTDGPALLAQQRQWLRDRQAACSVPQPLPDDKTALTACLSQQYQDRLQALAHPPQAVKGDDSLCQFVAAGLREKAKKPGVDWEYVMSFPFTGDQPTAQKSQRLKGTLSSLVSKIKKQFHPSQEESTKLDNWMDPEEGATLFHAEGSDLYMLQVIEGTANSTYNLFFKAAETGALKTLQDPPFPPREEGQLDIGISWEIATILGHPVVIVGNNNGDVVELSISTFQDVSWGKACSIQLKMGARQIPAEHHCADGQCSRFDGPALEFAKSFQNSPKAPLGLEPKSLTSEQTALWDKLKTGTDADGVPLEMPSFDKAGWRASMTMFQDGSYRFPALIDGQLMLVRIGEATLGWRDSEDVLVSFTAWQNGKAVPIAGVYVEKHRTAPTSITVQ